MSKQRPAHAWVLVALFAVALSANTYAADIAEAFGNDTYVLIDIPSVPVLRSNGNDGAYGAILAQEEVVRFLREGFPALGALKERIRDVAGRDVSEIVDVAVGRAVVAVVPDPNLPIGAVAVVEVDAASKQFQDFLADLQAIEEFNWNTLDVPGATVTFAQAGPIQIAYATIENRFVVGTSPEGVRVLCHGLMSGRSDNLASSPVYARCRAEGRLPGCELEAFINVADLIMPLLSVAPPEVHKALDESGFKGLSAVYYSSSPAGKGFVDRLFFYFPGGRKGVFAALKAAESEHLRFLKSVPSNVLSAGWTSVDPAGLYDSVAAIINAVVPPEELETVSSRWESIEEGSGVSIRDDIIGALSGSVVNYTVIPSQTLAIAFGGGMGQTVFSLGLADEERFSRALDALWNYMAEHKDEFSTQAADESPVPVQLGFDPKKQAFGDVTIYEAGISVSPAMRLTPSIAVSNSRLLVASDAQTLKNAISRPAEAPPLDENQDYAAAAGFAGVPTVAASYTDTRRVFDSLYSVVSIFMPLLTAQIQAPSPVDVLMLPPAQSISQHLFGSADATRATEDSLQVTAYGPVGALRSLWIAGVIGGTIGNYVEMHRPGIRREAAEQTEKTQLKILGLALLMYSNDYSGDFPTNLEILQEQGYLRDDSGVDPQRFRYVSGLRDDDPPGVILAFSREKTPAGRNALFIDGHVMNVSESELVEQIGGWLDLGDEPTPQEKDAACEKNMKALAESIKRYADVHEGALPESLDRSVHYRFALLVTNCPSDDEIGESDYAFVAGLNIAAVPDGRKGSVVLVYEKEPRHDGKAGLVFLDGAFRHVPADELALLVEASRNP